jgi:hypothetical protein
LKLHKAGKSLRGIADETSSSLQTVRTIIGRGRGSDRTSMKRREKIEIDKHERAHWKAPKRTGDALPKQVQAVIETPQGAGDGSQGAGQSAR